MVKGDKVDYFGLSGLTSEQLREQGFRVWTPPQEKGAFISEGDTPVFLNLLDNGLRAHEDGFWGGWGGRRRADAPAAGGQGRSNLQAGPDDPGVGLGLAPAGSRANASQPAVSPTGAAGLGRSQISAKTALVRARFFAAAQHDFAARLKWSVAPHFSDALPTRGDHRTMIRRRVHWSCWCGSWIHRSIGLYRSRGKRRVMADIFTER